MNVCWVCGAPIGFTGCEACREKARRSKLTPEERRYEDEFGAEALERQKALAKDHFVCCGEHISDGHHEACPKRPADVLPVVIEGQAMLA